MLFSKIVLNPYRNSYNTISNHYKTHQLITRLFPKPDSTLFRLERYLDRTDLLVYSTKKPVLDETKTAKIIYDIITKEFNPKFEDNMTLRFKLRANPSVKRENKRHGLKKEDEQREWLLKKGKQHGFIPQTFICKNQQQYVSWKSKCKITHYGVDFEGVLLVTDNKLFLEAIEKGIGSAKGFGFGLITVART